VRLRCPRAPKCPRGRWIDRDDLMPPGTVICVQPCDRHVEAGYWDLQTTYLDKDGKELGRDPDDHATEKEQSGEMDKP
jgi:hypothetical protein